MTTTALLDVLPPDGRDRLMEFAHDVAFEAGARIFEEGGLADHFWIIHTGSVNLDIQVCDRLPAHVGMLGHGDLLGWSWLVPPYTWQVGAEASSPVRAHEFDARAVRALCEADTALGLAVTHRVLDVLAHRLQATRRHLLDLYGPPGARIIPASP
ncbi:Crp/Fnr family transcriptional regulator [Streptomyces sp. NPDC101393]|uniref:Crp/Fnr family transcriptional regulator n=1 Tax=Streptomyces sp. NPDC101393 TaxID=3366141 RepID=UPI00380AFD6B